MGSKSIILTLILSYSLLQAQEADLAKKLANHLWDFAGDDARSPVNATFLQPFVAFITPTKTTFTFNTESTYDWENEQWTVPLNLIVSQLFKVGGQPLQAFVGARYYAEKPDNGPEWGLRFGLTLLFPK